jgi:ABC-type phosphonate transport system ATPase subunit
VLEQDLAGFEDGFETRIGSKGVKLSGGQVLRTAAARMFVPEPELLVFDDLSSALDVNTEALLWERVFEHSSETTKQVVSHAYILDFPLLAHKTAPIGLLALRSKSVISACGTSSLLPLVGVKIWMKRSRPSGAFWDQEASNLYPGCT